MGVSCMCLWWASWVVVGGWMCRSGAPPSQPLFTIRATSRQSWQLGHLGGNRWVPLAPAVSRAATSNPPPATGCPLAPAPCKAGARFGVPTSSRRSDTTAPPTQTQSAGHSLCLSLTHTRSLFLTLFIFIPFLQSWHFCVGVLPACVAFAVQTRNLDYFGVGGWSVGAESTKHNNGFC